jgi:energy-coupling factor transporter ATP-binding protein EcfA2
MENQESSKTKILIPDQVKIIQSPYDYAAAWAFLHDKGVELYGKKFRLYEEDTEIIIKLIAWFTKDQLQADKLQIELSKGILLLGPVGCGKTSLMNICRFLLPADQRHSMKSCREVTFEFIKDGYDVIHRYTKGSFSTHKYDPKTICFDDLGLENIMNYYGNNCSVIGEILLSRYDLFHGFGMLTHLTTNLNSNEIETLYGIRVRSRMREMFNLVPYGLNAKDKRV